MRKEAVNAMTRGLKGQAIVEFAFTSVLIFALLIAMVGLAVVFYSYVTISNMAREGTSYLIRNATSTDDNAVKQYIKLRGGVLQMTEPHPMRIVIEPDAAHISQRVPCGPVAVTVYYEAPLPVVSLPYIITPGRLTILPPITLRAVSKGRFEGGCTYQPTPAGTVTVVTPIATATSTPKP
jgi:hypothetical protein